MKRDVPIIGFTIGILLPVLGFVIMYAWWGKIVHGMSLGEFISSLSFDHKAFAKVLTMSLLINLAPFVYCNSKRYDYTMRGIVVATMLYAVVIVLMLYVW